MSRLLAGVITFIVFVSMSQIISAKNVFVEQPAVKEFIQSMVKNHGYEESHLNALFSEYEPSQEVITKIKTPFESVSWGKYQRYLITDDRIQQGVEFWRAHQSLLERAEKKYGIPPELVIAILGIESFYGKHQGTYPVFQSLATLAFYYPPRSKFFKKELEEFLLLTRDQQINPLTVKGSYAGAMGAPQFIASSYRRYAVDFSNKGQIDLMNEISTAVGSVANYFKVHGWQSGQPVVHRAHLINRHELPVPEAKSNDPKPAFAIYTLTKQGLVPQDKTIRDSQAEVAVLALHNDKDVEYWLARKNFYVITRYNHNSNYAMAVYQLSQKIKEAYLTKYR